MLWTLCLRTWINSRENSHTFLDVLYAQTSAAQPPVFDALDSVSLRTWINSRENSHTILVLYTQTTAAQPPVFDALDSVSLQLDQLTRIHTCVS